MRTIMSFGVWGAASLVLAMSGFSAQASNLIRNGSFETPVVPAANYQVFNTGGTFRNWRVVGAGGNVAIINQDFTYCGHTFPARAGIQFVDLTGTSNTATGLRQTINTVAGSTYSLSFFIGNVYDTSSNCGTTSTVNVVIGGYQSPASPTRPARAAQLLRGGSSRLSLSRRMRPQPSPSSMAIHQQIQPMDWMQWRLRQYPVHSLRGLCRRAPQKIPHRSARLGLCLPSAVLFARLIPCRAVSASMIARAAAVSLSSATPAERFQ
jgi:uncharacterized protein DUF642